MTSLEKNVLTNYLGQGWSALMGLAFVPLYIKYLGIESYALIGIFTVLLTWLTLLDLGMTPTLNREMARFTAGAHTPQSIRDLLRSIELICYPLALLSALAVWGGSGFLAREWVQPESLSRQTVAEAIGVMALVLGLRFCEGIYRGSLIGLQRQVWLNAVSALLATLRHGGAVGVLVWVAPSIRAFFFWQAAISLLTLVVLAVAVHRALPRAAAPGRFSRAALTGVGKFSGGMIGITFLALLLTQVDKVLLSRLLPLESFGYYTLAATVAGALALMVGPIILGVYPRLVQFSTHQDGPGLARLYHEAAQFITATTAPVTLLLACFAVEVIHLWSGDAALARNTGPILSALVLGTFLNSLMWLPYHCQLAHGWTSLTLKVNVVAVLALVPAIFWVVPRWGAVGAAWIWFVLNAAYVLVVVQLMHRRIMPAEKWRWYFRDLSLPFAGAAAVMLAAHVLRPAEDAGRLPWLLFLMTALGVAMVAAAVLSDRIRPWLLARMRRAA